MFKEDYRKMYDQIHPDKKLVAATVASERIRRKAHKYFRPIYRRPVFVSIVAAFCLLAGVPVFAAKVPAIYALLYQVSPASAQFFKPVQKSCENNGIKMEVVSTYIHKNTAEIYLTMQDLIGTRVDATTDLFDSYSIIRPFNSSAGCQKVGFDEASNTATFLVSITEFGNKDITGDKITFSVREFISGKRIYDGIPLEIDLSKVSETSNTMPMPTKNGFGGDYDFEKLGTPIILTPSSPISFGIEGINITGMGYVNGQLHIQTVVENSLENDNHGYFYFIGKDGSEIKSTYSVGFNEYENGVRQRYTELVYDIPQSRLDEYEIYGYFVISGNYTAGPWQVTFPLE